MIHRRFCVQVVAVFALVALKGVALRAQSLQGADEAATWGLRQVSHMVADYPAMKRFQVGKETHWVTRDSAIWQWTAAHFAGKGTGFWAAWHEAPPEETFTAMHRYGTDKAYIYSTQPHNAKDLTPNQLFETLWSQVAFELLNIQNAQGFADAWTAACEGRLSRKNYILRYAELEHQAMGKLQTFFTTVWQPWAKQAGFVSEPQLWRRNYHPDFAEWMRNYPPGCLYPWGTYGKHFDDMEKRKSTGAAAAPAEIKAKPAAPAK